VVAVAFDQVVHTVEPEAPPRPAGRAPPHPREARTADRASFTAALQTARDQLIAAPGTHKHNPTDDHGIGVIGRAVLDSLLPARQPRTSARKVKCATSRYLHRDDGRPLISTTIVEIGIGVHTPPLTPTPLARRRIPITLRPPSPRGPTRRERVVAILANEPRTDWSGKDLAQKLQIKPHSMLPIDPFERPVKSRS